MKTEHEIRFDPQDATSVGARNLQVGNNNQ